MSLRRDTEKARAFMQRGRESSARSLDASRRQRPPLARTGWGKRGAPLNRKPAPQTDYPAGMEITAERFKSGKLHVTFACTDCGAEVEREVGYLKKTGSTTCASCSNKRRRRRAVVTCDGCGERFEDKQSEIDRRERHFCSRECWRKHGRLSDEHYARIGARYRITRMGRGNPAYKHGKRTGDRISGWSVSKKGEDRCRNCGIGGVGLHLHHAVPRSLSRTGRSDLRNGIPLCPSCHKKWHSGMPIDRNVFTATEWAFLEEIAPNIGWLARRYPRTRPESEAA